MKGRLRLVGAGVFAALRGAAWVGVVVGILLMAAAALAAVAKWYPHCPDGPHSSQDPCVTTQKAWADGLVGAFVVGFVLLAGSIGFLLGANWGLRQGRRWIDRHNADLLQVRSWVVERRLAPTELSTLETRFSEVHRGATSAQWTRSIGLASIATAALVLVAGLGLVTLQLILREDRGDTPPFLELGIVLATVGALLLTLGLALAALGKRAWLADQASFRQQLSALATKAARP